MRKRANYQEMLWEVQSQIWNELPEKTRMQCQNLLMQILVKMIHREPKERKERDEREDSANPS